MIASPSWHLRYGPRLPRHLGGTHSHIPHNFHKGQQKSKQEPLNKLGWLRPALCPVGMSLSTEALAKLFFPAKCETGPAGSNRIEILVKSAVPEIINQEFDADCEASRVP